ncbi:hypothetical protein Ae168Ps1_2604 [Pseudonocardia sp. Ae168_Ps1]|uniref:maleylpyruvate isomerase N-terminal domain-containing protein n=1 Tax=unclassified Pseudonocardia TaxID=2619320 RepID=UPI00094AA93E|nr:hypothetical protein Ae150APs1_2594 [Pseudonocardia sp. Ae150A_Ps1]OLL80198.1 hypothetical protein Ae168Ps1_2604 [Pseudonocardia sp. Ae168_Ps1]OLL85674.1 hypothetical protein Ae263Ps1_2729c [Pseudonocardia sp. Ae263_Ps1]OLL94296.1 hypothetical protein Ae356Ps1_4193 [Pseudonocardia sp. Ae356_Ps1]
MPLTTRDDLWAAIHAERAALAEDLGDLTDEQWATPSLCGRWTVEEVVAHLTAAANTGTFRWVRSMLAARFDDGVHNDRRLAEHRGVTPRRDARTLPRGGHRHDGGVRAHRGVAGRGRRARPGRPAPARHRPRPVGRGGHRRRRVLRAPRLHREQPPGRRRAAAGGHGRTVRPRLGAPGPRDHGGTGDGAGRACRRARRAGRPGRRDPAERCT